MDPAVHSEDRYKRGGIKRPHPQNQAGVPQGNLQLLDKALDDLMDDLHNEHNSRDTCAAEQHETADQEQQSMEKKCRREESGVPSSHRKRKQEHEDHSMPDDGAEPGQHRGRSKRRSLLHTHPEDHQKQHAHPKADEDISSRYDLGDVKEAEMATWDMEFVRNPCKLVNMTENEFEKWVEDQGKQHYQDTGVVDLEHVADDAGRLETDACDIADVPQGSLQQDELGQTDGIGSRQQHHDQSTDAEDPVEKPTFLHKAADVSGYLWEDVRLTETEPTMIIEDTRVTMLDGSDCAESHGCRFHMCPASPQ